ncbi:MAG: hypothetical protein K8F91_00040, partial [Candidatus Obscuribacterales bacterium]|nr:hypothetical protein [Candidatus Obscuribacterales bacterium]
MVNQFDKQSESTETGPEQTSKEEQAAGAQDCHASQSISGDASMVHECGSVSRLELGFLVLASFFAAGLALFYMQGEDALYWSDYNYYRYMTWFLKEQVLTNPLSTPLLVFVSTGLMYNFFFALPLLPFAIVFGDSRSVFIASMAAVYLAPFAFMLGIIARQTIKSELAAPRRLALYAGAGLALTIPTLWAPVLRGYPDHGSAMFVLLAMILYIKNRARLSAKSIVLIGLCLGLAPLLRRHFFYLSFSFAAAMLIHQVYLARISSLSPMQFVRGPLCRWCSVGVTSALLLLTVGFLFVNSMLTSDFLTLYKSAYVSAFEGFVYFYQAFGGLVLLFSVAGFFLAIKSKMLDKSTAVLVFSFSLISFFVWPIFGRHVAIHYTIYAAPLVVLGNVFLLLYLGTRSSRMAKAAACALFLFQLANFSIGLMPESVVSRLPFTPARFGMLTVALAEPEPAGLSLILSANYAPQVRHDFSEMERLFAYLLKEGGKGPVFVSTSNHILA